MLANPFVMAHDFETFEKATNDKLTGVKTRLSSLEVAVCTQGYKARKSDLEGTIRQVESEIFQLERVAQEGHATDRDHKRLDDLRTDKGKFTRELQDLLRDENCAQAGNHH